MNLEFQFSYKARLVDSRVKAVSSMDIEFKSSYWEGMCIYITILPYSCAKVALNHYCQKLNDAI